MCLFDTKSTWAQNTAHKAILTQRECLFTDQPVLCSVLQTLSCNVVAKRKMDEWTEQSKIYSLQQIIFLWTFDLWTYREAVHLSLLWSSLQRNDGEISETPGSAKTIGRLNWNYYSHFTKNPDIIISSSSFVFLGLATRVRFIYFFFYGLNN